MQRKGYYRDGMVYSLFYKENNPVPFLDKRRSFPLEDIFETPEDFEDFIYFDTRKVSESELIFNEQGAWSEVAFPTFGWLKIK